jgi:hypothetical protein
MCDEDVTLLMMVPAAAMAHATAYSSNIQQQQAIACKKVMQA